MAYEWKFNPRPYSDEEAKTLLKNVVSPETTDWHYNTHHKGYVTALNNIEKGLESADRAAANGNYSPIGELKRRFTWNHSGAYLHDVYWQVMGGDGDPGKGPDIKSAIEKEFGSFDAWKADFKAAGVSAKLSGWSLLVYDRLYSGRLLNVLVDEHQYGAIWAACRLSPSTFSNTPTTTRMVRRERYTLTISSRICIGVGSTIVTRSTCLASRDGGLHCLKRGRQSKPRVRGRGVFYF